MNDKDSRLITNSDVAIYESSGPIFQGLLAEVRELSKKKPEATMSASKVQTINRVLRDLLEILKDEPEGKYLGELDDSALPQVSDAVFAMVQFETAMRQFAKRHKRRSGHGESEWITKESMEEQDQEEDEVGDEDEFGSDEEDEGEGEGEEEEEDEE